jgi:hypothetical protein
VGEDRPRNTGVLRGERHRGDICMPTLLQSPRPLTFRVRLFVDDAQVGSSAVHQERAQVAIALASDLPKPLLAAARVLSRGDPQPGGKASSIFEDVRVAHRGHQCRRGLRADRFHPHQSPCGLTGLG